MKCPKCHYLGFETGDRCKNCGYDFSLLESPPAEELDVDLKPQPALDRADAPDWLAQADPSLGRPVGDPIDVPIRETMPPPVGDEVALPAAELPVRPAASSAVADDADGDHAPRLFLALPAEGRGAVIAPSESIAQRSQPAAAAVARASAEPPLFELASDDAADAPLVIVPAAPRPPLSVRRTPVKPRLRAVPQSISTVSADPVLEFAEEEVEVRGEPDAGGPAAIAPGSVAPSEGRVETSASTGEVGGARARLAAAALDQLLLVAIDLTVVYFALRMVTLSMADWQLLPMAPLVAFLLLLKVAYFSAFTAVGGQTIGKMAAGVRVVTDEGEPVDGARALRRTLAGLVSTAVFGLGFLPALVGSDRRTLHDRVAGTRVVTLSSV